MSSQLAKIYDEEIYESIQSSFQGNAGCIKMTNDIINTFGPHVPG
jgi:hypothetical protein